MDSSVASTATALFEAELLAPLLRPLVTGGGFAGGYEATLFAQSIAQHDRSGFTVVLARQLRVAP